MHMLEREGRKLQTTSTWEDSWAQHGGLEPPLPGPRLGAQSDSQPVKEPREGRAAVPATSAHVDKVKTVPKGWGWELPAVGAGAQARVKLYLSDLTRYRSTRYANSRRARKKTPKTKKSM